MAKYQHGDHVVITNAPKKLIGKSGIVVKTEKKIITTDFGLLKKGTYQIVTVFVGNPFTNKGKEFTCTSNCLEFIK